jgi:hypothetical protein
MKDTKEYFNVIMKRIDFLNDRLKKSENNSLLMTERNALNWLVTEYMDLLKKQVLN